MLSSESLGKVQRSEGAKSAPLQFAAKLKRLTWTFALIDICKPIWYTYIHDKQLSWILYTASCLGKLQHPRLIEKTVWVQLWDRMPACAHIQVLNKAKEWWKSWFLAQQTSSCPPARSYLSRPTCMHATKSSKVTVPDGGEHLSFLIFVTNGKVQSYHWAQRVSDHFGSTTMFEYWNSTTSYIYIVIKWNRAMKSTSALGLWLGFLLPCSSTSTLFIAQTAHC